MPKLLGAFPQSYKCDQWLNTGSASAGFDIFDDQERDYDTRPIATIDASDFILDIREYDVPYHVRVAIDKGTALSDIWALPLY